MIMHYRISIFLLVTAALFSQASNCDSGSEDPECVEDEDCAYGTYCSENGICVYDCNFDEDCASGLVCDNHGRCSQSEYPTTDSDTDADGDLDVDIDSDTDADMDVDSDTDADSDSDNDADGDSDAGDGGGDSGFQCPPNSGTSIAGPYIAYGFCWYLTADGESCDTACLDLGGDNLALDAKDAFSDSCSGAGPQDVSYWFYNHSNPGEWAGETKETEYRTLGHGYRNGNYYYGKCSAVADGGVGAWPGEENDSSTRSLVCACFSL